MEGLKVEALDKNKCLKTEKERSIFKRTKGVMFWVFFTVSDQIFFSFWGGGRFIFVMEVSQF